MAISLKDALHYDPKTGVFTWKVKRKGVNPGDVAGSIGIYGYRKIQLNKKTYQAHRLAWFYVHGTWTQLDHINGIRDDNSLANLRPATQSQNCANRRRQTRTRSGFKGVYKRKYGWEATVMRNGKSYYLGKFKTPMEAHAAYLVAAKKLHGEFARGA